MTGISSPSSAEPADYDKLVDMFNRALIHTLRKHSVADNYLDLWVPDSDPVIGLLGMIDSARLAGIRDLSIRVSKKTLPAERIGELEQSAAKVCKIRIESEPHSFLLRTTELNKEAAAGNSPKSNKAATNRTYWRPAVETANQASNDPPPGWAASASVEFEDVHPHFRQPLKSAFLTIAFEVDAAPAAGEELQVTGQEGGTCLTLNVDRSSQIVRSAVHKGGASHAERAVLDLFCRHAPGLPIQEVADHLGLKILNSLVDIDGAAPVPGVLLPSNGGKPFSLVGRLARRAYDAFRAISGTQPETNFYYAPPSTNWESLSSEERLGNVERSVRAFLQSHDMLQDDIIVQRIERNRYGYNVRAIIRFAERIAVAEKPRLMRALEKLLRRDVERELEVVAERAKDSSPLRRLS